MRREALTFVGILFAAELLMVTFRAARDEVSKTSVWRGTRHTLDGLEDAVSREKDQCDATHGRGWTHFGDGSALSATCCQSSNALIVVACLIYNRAF